MSFAFIPLYTHFMGIEAYGLVGVFITLQAVMTLLDLGLGATLNREMARLAVRSDTGQELRDLLRSLECIFWPGALVIAAVLISIAPLMTNHWLRVEPGNVESTTAALGLIGLAVGLHWPFVFYSGGLLGLQRQVLLNSITAFSATVRGIGSVLVLWLVSPTATAFFAWQALASLLQTGLTALVLWRSLPAGERSARFDISRLRGLSRFAVGLSGISVFGLILTQMDKIILSRMLTLEMFGYYTLATAVATGLYRLISPFFLALYPRMTELVTQGRTQELRSLYHDSCQWLTVLVLPAALVVAFFSPEIMLLWTRNPVTVSNSAPILSLLIIGTALHGLIHLPYALQLAHGWTRLALYSNIASTIILMPLLVLATARHGAIGAAAVWVLLNLGYILINIQVMHRRILPGEQWRWYREDVVPPLAVAFGIVALSRWLFPAHLSPAGQFGALAALSLVALTAAAMAAPAVRGRIAFRTRIHQALAANR
jgi:O-antigen/teichoic acid export membrane protein